MSSFASSLLVEPNFKTKLYGALKKNFPEKARIEIISITSQKKVPPNSVVSLVDGKKPLGVVPLRFDWDENGALLSAFGSARVKVTCPIAVSKQVLQSGDRLDKNLVEFIEKDLSLYLWNGFFSSEEQLKGIQIRSYTPSGTVLSSFNTEPLKVVLQGQMVELQYKKESLKVSARVKALRDGRVGEWISVQNLSSKKILQARVVGMGEVSLQ